MNAEPTGTGSSASEKLQNQLSDIAKTLREADHLEADAQQELAELVQELCAALKSITVPSAEIEHLVETSTHLQQALHHKHTGPLLLARNSLERAAAAFEARTPLLAGVARRLVDALTNLGI